MTDKELFILVRSTLLPAIQAQPGLASVQLARSYQPRQQGATTGPCIYVFKVVDRLHGSPQRKDGYDALSGTFIHTLRQQYETTLQFSAWVPQEPADVTGLTESDVLNIVSGIIQTDATIEAFRAAGVGLQRVADVQNPYIVDDHDRFEAVPTFDIRVTHYRELAATVPIVNTAEANIHRV